MGDVKMYNLASSEETTYQVGPPPPPTPPPPSSSLTSTYQCHDSYVYHVQPSRDAR